LSLKLYLGELSKQAIPSDGQDSGHGKHGNYSSAPT